MFHVSILMLTQAGEDSTESVIGTGTGGTMNGFLTNDFNRTGRAGIKIAIGNGKEPGASRIISLAHNHRDRCSDSKGNSNINRDLRFSNISNRDNNRFNGQDHSNKENLRFNGQDQNLRRGVGGHRDNFKREVIGHRDNRRFSGQDHNLRREVSNHSTLSLKEDLKAGRENVESRLSDIDKYEQTRGPRPRGNGA